jgi:DNA repair protein RadA/Sms
LKKEAEGGSAGGRRPERAVRGARQGRAQYLCAECGDSFGQWFGRCPSCRAWGSLREYRQPAAGAAARGSGGSLLATALESAPAGGEAPRALGEISADSVPRLATGIGEFDRIVGGGLVAGSAVLLGGDPGIGKSTLLLQVVGALCRLGARALYVSGEESSGQIRLRSERLREIPPELLILPETNLEAVASAVEQCDPRVLVIDSIQTAFLPSVESAPGSLVQVRESALALIGLAKRRGLVLLLVGHVTKEGTLAGPRTLEHMVDTVLYMEGERYQHYRILRCVKNRFGGVHEIGVFEMAGDGLREVPNPSRIFLGEHAAGAVGSVVVAGLEGTRALLMEVQALVHETRYGTPQRVCTGYDPRRLEILLAVLGKRGGLDASRHDVFVSIAGGLRIDEPGVDLGVLLAVASSRLDRPPQPKLVVLGEVGLGGEVRRVSHASQRLTEASRLGFARALLPEANARDLDGASEGIDLIPASAVVQALAGGLQPAAERR